MNLSQIHITTPEHISVSYKVAGLGSRATAQVVDWMLTSILNFIIIFSYINLAEDFSFFENGYVIASMIIILFTLWWGYYVLFEFFAAGQTPGKMLVGLRVVGDNGQPITILSAFIRNLLRIIDYLPLFYFLGILMIFLHPKHKRIGDLAAGTIVIYEQKQRRKRKKSRMEQEIEKRQIDANSIELDDWSKKKIGSREWKLIKTYIERWPSLSKGERDELTMKVSQIIFPLVHLETENKFPEEMENDLFALYLQLREDWEYDLR